MDAGILVGVIVATERGRGVDVFHQQPRAIAACVIDACIRDALMHNDKVLDRTVHFDFNGAANGLCAQFYVCHCYLLVFVQAHGMISAGRVFCDTERDRALCCFL